MTTTATMRKRDSQIRAMVAETSEKTVKAALALSTSKPIGEIFSVEAIVSEGLNLGGLFISVYSQIILDATPGEDGWTDMRLHP